MPRAGKMKARRVTSLEGQSDAMKETSQSVFPLPISMQVNPSLSLLICILGQTSVSSSDEKNFKDRGGRKVSTCVLQTYCSLLIGMTVLANFPKPVVMP